MTATAEVCDYCRLWFGRPPRAGVHEVWREKGVHWHLYDEARAIKNRRRVDAAVSYTEPFAVARTPEAALTWLLRHEAATGRQEATADTRTYWLHMLSMGDSVKCSILNEWMGTVLDLWAFATRGACH